LDALVSISWINCIMRVRNLLISKRIAMEIG